MLCCTISRLFKPELITALAEPFGVSDGAAVVVFVPFNDCDKLFIGRPLRPDDKCVISSTFGVSTDDKCDDIGSRHALGVCWPTASAIERGKLSSSAPKSLGLHGLKKPDGADGEWHTTPLP